MPANEYHPRPPPPPAPTRVCRRHRRYFRLDHNMKTRFHLIYLGFAFGGRRVARGCVPSPAPVGPFPEAVRLLSSGELPLEPLHQGEVATIYGVG